MVSSKRVAREAELRFAAELTRRGWEIFFPFGEDSPVDILAFGDGKFMKVQVKAAKIKNGAIFCKLRSTNNWQNKKYDFKEVDVFAFYEYVSKKGYLVPLKDTEGKNEIKLRVEKPKNNQKARIISANDYLYFE